MITAANIIPLVKALPELEKAKLLEFMKDSCSPQILTVKRKCNVPSKEQIFARVLKDNRTKVISNKTKTASSSN